MAFMFNRGSSKIKDGTINLASSVIKVMLVTNAYTPTRDDDAIDLGSGTGLAAAELTVSGYSGGFSGAGRLTLANKVFVIDDASDRDRFDNTADLVWTTLGAGQTIHAAVVIWENTDDTDSVPISYHELGTATPTNGQNFTLQFHADGIFYSEQV